jgi:DNA (cytosine-5)-methyltransferase 1
MEQVPGLFSSHEGRDFDVAITALEELGYGLAWRTLDARHFGVPQRRRRVYLVGRLGAPCTPEVLFEREGSSGDLAPSDAAWEDAPDEAGDGVAHALRAQPNDPHREDAATYVPTVGATLKANTGRNHIEQDYVARALTSSMHKRHDPDTDTLVAETLSSNPRNRSASVGPIIVNGNSNPEFSEEAMPLRADNGSGGRQWVAAPPSVYRKSARMNADPNSPETWVEDGVANTLNSFDVGDVRTTHAVVAIQDVRGVRENKLNGIGITEDAQEMYSLTKVDRHGVGLDASVRRLTPRECERLMGFPDDWTAVDGPGVYAPRYSFRVRPNRHDRRAGRTLLAFFGRKRAAMDGWRIVRGTPDGPRYAACGNAVVANKAEWIGRNLIAAAALEDQTAAAA